MASSACGPIEYVNQVSRKAAAQVEAAQAVQADKVAPYWYTLAVEYLHKAREEAAHADYQAANRFGRRAGEAATKALEITLGRGVGDAGPATAPAAEAEEPETPDEGAIDPDAALRVDEDDPLDVESEDKGEESAP